MSALLESLLTPAQREAACKADTLARLQTMARQAQVQQHGATPLTPVYFHSDIIGSAVIAGLEIEESERHAFCGVLGDSYLVTLTLEGVDIAHLFSKEAADVVLSEALRSLRRKQ